MNLEKERLAFEASVLPNGVLKCVEWDGNRYSFVGGGCCGTQDYFEVWLKAKVHAAVMACPLAEVRKRKDNHQWAVYVPTSLTAAAYDFPHKEAAVAWAVRHGYRVEI